MKTSVIIPTCNRPKELRECLESLLLQTCLPDEILVIDDGESEETYEVVSDFKENFRKMKVTLKHWKKTEKTGLSSSKNLGVNVSRGEIIFFLDDDMELEKEFLEGVLSVYKNNPFAVGVQGYITNYSFSPFRNTFGRLFFLVHARKNQNRLLPSLQNVYAIPLTKVINCEWMAGGGVSYCKEIFSEFNFEEKFLGPSYGEDIDFSYRVYKKYPKGLLQTPRARCVHKRSPGGRMPAKKLIFIQEIHHWYLLHKLSVDAIGYITFLWSRLGRLILELGKLFLKPSSRQILTIFYLVQAYFYVFIHRESIRAGEWESLIGKGKK